MEKNSEEAPMKLRDIHLRDPFIFAENGVYYLYGTRRGPSTKVIPWQGLDVYLHRPHRVERAS